MLKQSTFAMHLLWILLAKSNILFAQTKTNGAYNKSHFTISGNFIMATDLESIYITYGGPALKFTFSKNLYACVSMYPGLRWKADVNKPLLLPILGAGMHIGYKSLILAFPFYYISNKNKWKAAIGLGVRFESKQKKIIF